MAERDELIDPLLLKLTNRGHRFFRNNSGVAFHKDGSVVRYGLPALGGGPDLIGWTVLTCTPQMVGRHVALFSGIELKTGTLRPTVEQLAFLGAIHLNGGVSLWGRDVTTILAAHEAAVEAITRGDREEEA